MPRPSSARSGSSRPTGPRKSTGSRTLIALANAALAFATGCAVWLLFFQVFSGMLDTTPPFMPVIIFAVLMAVLSFVLEVDFVLRIFSRIWRLVGWLLSKLH